MKEKVMAESTMTSKGQMTIPKSVRTQLNLKPGVKMDVQVEADGSMRIRPKNLKFRDVFGMLESKAASRKPVTVDEMNAGIARAVRKKFAWMRRSK